MVYTIDDLLDSLQNPATVGGSLPNNKDTWSRIGSRDFFTKDELGSSTIEGWLEDNDYTNI